MGGKLPGKEKGGSRLPQKLRPQVQKVPGGTTYRNREKGGQGPRRSPRELEGNLGEKRGVLCIRKNIKEGKAVGIQQGGNPKRRGFPKKLETH